MELRFQIGLTDETDSEAFVYQKMDTIDNSNEKISYNLYKQNPEIEKEMIEWKIRTDIPVVLKTINKWEQTIRRPHLCMINIDSKKNKFIPTVKDISLNLEFIDLLPTKFENLELTDEDFEHFSSDIKFGQMCYFTHGLWEFGGTPYINTIEWAYFRDSLENLKPNGRAIGVPLFQVQMGLVEQRPGIVINSDSMFTKWLDDKKESIEATGFDITKKDVVIGRLPFAELIDDEWEVLQKMEKYPRICRTSIKKIE